MDDRYSRQIIFSEIGKEGQEKLGNSSVVIIGCGGLGSAIATSLVRAGVGKVKLVDRDFVEYHNLHRQILFDEEDVKSRVPKAIAAERYLKRVNSSVEVEGVFADVNYINIEKFVTGADLILDGLDNPETRFLINDVSLKHKIPWIYGGAVAATGMTMNIIPGETPCFRCAFPFLPDSQTTPNCNTVGVIGPVPFLIGSIQSTEAIKILIGSRDINRDVIAVDLWQGTCRRFQIKPRQGCPSCQGEYEFLGGQSGVRTTILCSQNAVQVFDAGAKEVSFKELAPSLKRLGEVSCDEYMLHFTVDDHELVVFCDGRVILKNSFDESLAKALYAKYIAGAA